MSRNSITSVGIDIGTSTTQIVFSRLTLGNSAGYFSVPRIVFVDKEVFYQSPVYFTPLKDPISLDDAAIRDIILAEYSAAGLTPAEVATGAAIITGEAARKENAARLLSAVSDLAGEFVAATAGPDLEAVISGRGSGAQAASKRHSTRIAHLNIGGGTTNIVVFDDGDVIAKGCFDVGGRLIRVDDGRVSYVSGSASLIAASAGVDLQAGSPASEEALRQVCAAMARLLEEALGLCAPSPLLEKIRTPGSTPFTAPPRIQAISFSGGVADCIDQSEKSGGGLWRYGDIGPLLGEAIAGSRLCRDFTRLPSDETLRATVIGAGSYATTVSGSTISHSHSSRVLPVKNVPALKLNRAEQDRCFDGDADFLSDKIRRFLEQRDESRLILAMAGEPSPSYARLRKLAECLCDAMSRSLPPKIPILLALESDTAKALGQIMGSILSAGAGSERDIVCIDSVTIEDGDYADLGKPLMDGQVIPLVIKTLSWSDSQVE